MTDAQVLSAVQGILPTDAALTKMLSLGQYTTGAQVTPPAAVDPATEGGVDVADPTGELERQRLTAQADADLQTDLQTNPTALAGTTKPKSGLESLLGESSGMENIQGITIPEAKGTAFPDMEGLTQEASDTMSAQMKRDPKAEVDAARASSDKYTNRAGIAEQYKAMQQRMQADDAAALDPAKLRSQQRMGIAAGVSKKRHAANV